jgi:hypothetical protein
MAVTQMDTYTQAGKVEDVSDIISILTPTATPAQTLMGSKAAKNTLYQWQEDALDPPAVNAAIEGAVAPAANMNPTVMRSNNTQIFTKTVKVTNSARKMSIHGTADEFNRQMAKKSKEIKRDFELALVGTKQTTVAGSSSVAAKINGVQAMHDTSVKLANGGTPRALTETLFLAASQLAYNNGSEPTTALIKPADSLIVAGFAAATGRLRELDPGAKKLVNVVEVYEGPFGTHRFVTDRFSATTDLILIDPSMWKIRPFRPWHTIALAVTGDFVSSELIGEFGLQHSNFFDGVVLTDLS